VVAKNPVVEILNTAVSGYGGNGETVDQNKKGKNIPPQISAHIKPRHPLRFFPDVLPASSRNLGKGLTIQLNDKGQRRVVWNSKNKVHVGEHWVPREGTKSKSEKGGPQELVHNFAGGSSVAGLGLESQPNFEVGFGLNSVFEVGSSSGHKPYGHLKTGGSHLNNPEPQVEERLIEEKSLELLGTAAPALVHRGRPAHRVEWGGVDAFCRWSRWGLAGVPLKVRILPIPIFSCFQFERVGIVARLLGLVDGAVTGVVTGGGARVEVGLVGGAVKGYGDRGEFGGVMGLTREIISGGWDVGECLGVAEGGCNGGLTGIGVEEQYLEWGGSLPQSPQREDACAIVTQSGEEILEVTPLRMVSGLLEEGKNKAVDPSEWVMDRMKKFSKFMRVDITDHEEEAMCLFMEIEARWRAKGGPSAASKKPTGSVKKGMRELKNLATSVNYDSRKSGDGRSGVVDRALSVIQ
jgi:hypothetical protein